MFSRLLLYYSPCILLKGDHYNRFIGCYNYYVIMWVYYMYMYMHVYHTCVPVHSALCQTHNFIKIINCFVTWLLYILPRALPPLRYLDIRCSWHHFPQMNFCTLKLIFLTVCVFVCASAYYLCTAQWFKNHDQFPTIAIYYNYSVHLFRLFCLCFFNWVITKIN